MVVFESLPDVAIPVGCPECAGQHRWRPKDAWVAEALTYCATSDIVDLFDLDQQRVP
jgi:hypothetical protein